MTPPQLQRLAPILASYPVGTALPLEWVQAGAWLAVRRAYTTHEPALLIVGEVGDWSVLPGDVLARVLTEEAQRRSVLLSLRIEDGIVTRDAALETYNAVGFPAEWKPIDPTSPLPGGAS
ncbi:MAG: hypothetical protein K2R93_12520 [Gemmatimonadaceae bacterium]|nr:hypothetical protein [Gemmatimonadaceae bacterium]